MPSFAWPARFNHMRAELGTLPPVVSTALSPLSPLRRRCEASDATCLAKPFRQGGERRWRTFLASC